MAFTLPTNVAIEKFRSRRGRASSDGSTEMAYVYTCSGSNDVGDILGYADTAAPAFATDPVSGGILWRDEVDWDQIGDETWEVTVTYVTPDRYDQRKHERPDLGEYELSWDTTGGTARITSSRATTKYPATATDHKGAIGLDAEGNVQGVDIVVPACKFTVTYRLANATVSNAYGMVVELLTGTVNDATFFGRPAGEFLFMGAQGKTGIKTDPVFNFHFVRLPNVTGLTIGDITGIAKKGHEYLWVEWKPGEKDANSGRTPQEPIGVYVETVYHEGDFSALGIGGGA
jgi:hypothetical protein